MEILLRVALLSILDNSVPGGGIRASFRQFAGRTILERQIDLALAAGCETVACLVDGISREVTEAQRHAEQAGIKFVAMQQTRSLSGLVTAADEILVMAAGNLPAAEPVVRSVSRPVILAFPAEDAVPRGHERIDQQFAWSGVMLLPGSIVERLAELPPDSDTVSALLRLGLQAGVKVLPLEKRLLIEGKWHWMPTVDELGEREDQWIRDHAEVAEFNAPGLAVAERVGARLARDALGTRAARVPAIGAAICGLGALGCALVGLHLPAMLLGTLMAVLSAAGETVERIAGAGQAVGRRSRTAAALDWLTDPVFIILIALASPEDTQWLRLFVPIILFALMRLGNRMRSDRWKATYRDRIAVGGLLVPCVAFGLVQPATAVLALIVLVTLFLAPHRGE